MRCTCRQEATERAWQAVFSFYFSPPLILSFMFFLILPRNSSAAGKQSRNFMLAQVTPVYMFQWFLLYRGRVVRIEREKERKLRLLFCFSPHRKVKKLVFVRGGVVLPLESAVRFASNNITRGANPRGVYETNAACVAGTPQTTVDPKNH